MRSASTWNMLGAVVSAWCWMLGLNLWKPSWGSYFVFVEAFDLVHLPPRKIRPSLSQLGMTATSSSSTKNTGDETSNSSPWYVTRIQDSIDYNDIVERLFLRQVVVETKEMAVLAQNDYSQRLLNRYDDDGDEEGTHAPISSKSDDDPFATVADLYSVDRITAENRGQIGWVDNPLHRINKGKNETLFDAVLPRNVLEQLLQLRPKAGDMHILQSKTTGQWHLLHVLELWVQMTSTDSSSDDPGRVGSFTGYNQVLPRRRKLKGRGVLPEFPELTSYWIQTAGCQMNVADSERLAGVLQHQLKLTPAAKASDAELILLNTCSIRDHAEQKLYDALGPFAAQKRNGSKRLALVVTGCVAQQEGQALLQRIPEIDVVLGPQYIPFLHNVLEQVSMGQQVVATAPMLLQEDVPTTNNLDTANGWANKPIRGHDVRAWVNVIYGCNEHCTYCVVPATRGMEQSRTMEAILQECLDLVKDGYREITLIGQNIDAYGRDMTPKRTFAELLEYLNDRIPTSDLRIRYVTSHPRYFGQKVIDAVANLDKVCECFHMPFQAGDDTVLKRMRRGYTYDSYMKIIDRIRRAAPDASISTDIIVGFPGETEEQFQKTLKLMEEVKFDNVNSFAYSPRPNTEAALWTQDQVDEATKSDRLQRVQALAVKHGLERSQRYLGRVEQVLVEDANPKVPTTQVMGRTRQGRQVYFDGDLDELRGQFVNVEITEARTWVRATRDDTLLRHLFLSNPVFPL